MSNIKWSCKALNTSNASSEFLNKVVSVLWSCVVTDASHMVDVTSLCSIEHKTQQDFLSYDQLNEQHVLQWVWENGVDKNLIEEMLNRQLDEKKLNSVVKHPLPWATA